MYDEYEQTMDALHGPDSQLERNFDNSVFAATAINFTDEAVCGSHCDSGNRPDGLCIITCMGPLDHTKGGQIVLDEPKLVIDFPSGSSVYIPSALVTHHNFPLQNGDKRYSATQYTGGGLFRWVRNGMKSDKDWYATASQSEIKKREQDNASRWKKGLSLFPRVA